MSRRNRSANLSFGVISAIGGGVTLLVLGVLLWTLAVKHERYAQGAKQQAAYAQGYADKEAEHCAGFLGAIRCLIHDPESSRETERAEEDVAAQKEMAEWALWIAFISGAQAVLSLGAIYLVWRTLETNRDAVDAAQDAVIATRETGEAYNQAPYKPQPDNQSKTK